MAELPTARVDGPQSITATFLFDLPPTWDQIGGFAPTVLTAPRL